MPVPEKSQQKPRLKKNFTQAKFSTFLPWVGDRALFNALKVLEGRLSTPSAATSFKLVSLNPDF